jgi:hypothetical protein
MALEKRVVEFPFDKGMDQKLSLECAPDGVLDQVINCNLAQIGEYSKRTGHSLVSSTIIGGGSLANILAIASRGDQLVAISSDVVSFGSGGGAGSAGDTIYSSSDAYSGAWVPNAKIQRPTVETMMGISQDERDTLDADCAVIGDVAAVVFRKNNGGYIMGGIYASVYDVSSDMTLIDAEPLLVTATVNVLGSVKCLTIGTKMFAFWLYDNGTGADAVWCSYFDTSSVGSGWSTPALVANDGTDMPNYDVCTDGTYIYIATISQPAFTRLSVYKRSALLASVDSQILDPLVGLVGIACSTIGGQLHMVTREASANLVKFAQTDTATLAAFTLTTVMTTSTTVAHVQIASLSSSEAWVFALEAGVAATTPALLYWMRVAPTAPVAASGSLRIVQGLRPSGKPFFTSGRLYMTVSGYDPEGGDNYGYALLEFDVSATGAVTGYSQPLPVAAWANDVSQEGALQRDASTGNGCFVNGAYWHASLVITRTFDTFVSQSTSLPVASWQEQTEDGIRLMKLDFNDEARWLPAKHGERLVFSGGLPYVFDGQHAHECGFIWRPRILDIDLDAGAGTSLPANATLNYRLVYEYYDVKQARWQSVPSLATDAQVATGATQDGVVLLLRPPCLSAKPRGGSYFMGLCRAVVYRSHSNAPREWIKVFEEKVEPFRTTYMTFTDTFSEDDILANERMYTYGGELENYSPPPCRALVEHRDRLFAINTEDNTLWYTKPLINGRGTEWSRYQKQPLFEKGMALGSTESALIVLCRNSIYALQGGGPSVTGLPIDGFSKLYCISDSMGCIAKNAAWSTPVGVVFRSDQGFWLVDNGLSLKYIGAPLERQYKTEVADDDGTLRFFDGEVDPALGVFRIMVTASDGDERWNYWYDSNRWSRDTFHMEDAIIAQACHKGTMHLSTTDKVLVSDPDVYTDDLEDYFQKIHTSFFRFGALGGFKRVWRTIVTVSGGNVENSALEVSFDPTNVSNAEFGGSVWDIANEHKAIRVHMADQKRALFRVFLDEVREDGYSSGPGFTFYGLSFELGLKRGGVKLAQEFSR